ncbi:MAG: SU10 major capsid protein [Aeromonas popoffii]|uniref:SU10 major capsid protein n=1 Tax=Aeromonas popoffii TaxID=70856 RepID=UPI003F2C067B
MAILTSYDLKGKKDSFANWISNLSPVDTFFVSTTKKEQVKNTMFQWQTDSLAAADKNNAQVETSAAITADFKATTVHSNVTQILRKAVEVSDTADALDNWGRQKELAYQMEKAGTEIKRDLELILLLADNAGNGKEATGEAGTEGETAFVKNSDQPGSQTGAAVTGTARKTRSFGNLVGDGKLGDTVADPDTGAKVVVKTKTAGTILESELFNLTYNLYLSGSSANTIMFHPKHAAFFSSLMETAAGRQKLIANMDTTLNKFVGSLIDPLGQQFSLVPNRFMPETVIYVFNPDDWTQMVLREPSKVELAKKGSSERHMIEMEIGLRHKNPYASGILNVQS